MAPPRLSLALAALVLGAEAMRTGSSPHLSRRSVLCCGALSCAPAAALADDDAAPTMAQQTLGSLNAGARKLSEAGVEEGDLVAELLRRTEANKERNAALVKKQTEANAFTAIDGAVDRRLVTDLSGKNLYLDANEIKKLVQERRLACAPSVMEACRMIEPGLVQQSGVEPGLVRPTRR